MTGSPAGHWGEKAGLHWNRFSGLQASIMQGMELWPGRINPDSNNGNLGLVGFLLFIRAEPTFYHHVLF